MEGDSKGFFYSSSWYSKDGPMDDVAVSSRVRLARNLANFPFPLCLTSDGKSRINAIISGSFSRLEDAERYQFVPLAGIDSLGAKVFSEWGLIREEDAADGALVMCADGVVSCRTNSTDHLRICAFLPGLCCAEAFDACRALDTRLQQDIQFAASYDFGYLTAAAQDSGSGLKASVRVHIPCIALDGRIPQLSAQLQEKGLSMDNCYGSGGIFESALGAFFEIRTTKCFDGGEMDQLAAITAAVTNVVEQERSLRAQYIEKKPTVISGIVYRAYGIAKYSAFLDFRETIEIISALKLGVDTEILHGLANHDFAAMLYRTCGANLAFVVGKGTFKFESDVDSEELKVRRLRSELMKEEIRSIK